MTEAGWTCSECGMPCEADEYHPYAACLMYQQCHDSETVRDNLIVVGQASYQQGRVAGLREITTVVTRARSCTSNDGSFSAGARATCRYIQDEINNRIKQAGRAGGDS